MRTEIDLGAIRRNVARVEKAMGKSTILMCKADAYGHGLLRVAKAVPAEYYGVATEEEGIPLRNLGKEVLVTAPSFSGLSLDECYRMIPMIGDFEIARRAAVCGVRRCRIKVNSGMNRLGFTGEKECYEAALFLASAGVKVEGIDTHYKEGSDRNVLTQNAAFRRAILAVRKGLVEGGQEDRVTTSVTGCGALHAAEYDYLRIGLAAYGYHTGYATSGLPLEPAMRVTSEVIKCKYIHRGDTLGYASSGFRASGALRAYTVLGGYGDGIARAEKGRQVIATGRRLRIAAVSMDTFEMISDRVDLEVGTRVIILSKGVDAAYIARARGTIPYEVLVGYNVPRAERVYVGEE